MSLVVFVPHSKAAQPCGASGGAMQFLAVITDTAIVRRILDHLSSANRVLTTTLYPD